MVDSNLIVDALLLLATITLVWFTWILLPDSPWFAITARRHWVGIMERRSRDFGLFMGYLDSDELRRRSPRLKTVDQFGQLLFAIPLLVLLIGSLIDRVPVEYWDIFVGLVVLGMFLPRLATEFLTRRRSRVESLVGKQRVEDWTASDGRLAVLLMACGRNLRSSALLALVAPIGVFFSYGEDPSDSNQIMFGLLFVILGLYGGLFWAWYILRTERTIQSRVFRAFTRARPGFRVTADVYYAGNGCVVESGEVRDLDTEFRVRDDRDGWYEMGWKRIDLIVPHDPPPDTVEAAIGIA